MRTAERKLLYVNAPVACDVARRLKNEHWEVSAVHNIDGMSRELAREKSQSTYDLGLIRFPASDTGYIEGFVHDCLALQDTEWIALLPKELAENSSVQQLIACNFHDFHTLPTDTERLVFSIGHAYGMACLKRQVRNDPPLAVDKDMVGSSPAMTAVFRSLRKVANNNAPVLITGETGTGKELAARAIHDSSPRAGGPYVAINCGAIPPNLIQSELFGYERGAFTGASQRKLGRIELANGGTLFLDEIGDLPLDLQANLLRFLQERQVDRIGGQAPVTVDVRVVAATHVDLPKAIADGRFREDLYHRLGVLCVQMPPLRERGDDIEVLARYFFSQFTEDGRRSLRGFSREALATIRTHPWPGNIRELINRIQRAVVMSEGRLITPRDLDLGHGASAARHPTLSLDAVREQAERHALQLAMQQNPANLSRAAQSLGISRVTLYRLLEKHGLRLRQEAMQ